MPADLSPTAVLNNSSNLSSRPGCQAAITAKAEAALSDGVLYTSIFPNNQIPLACMDPTAVDLLQFVPLPNCRYAI